MPPNDAGFPFGAVSNFHVTGTRKSLHQVLQGAIAELSLTGYVNPDAIEFWLREIRQAAESETGQEAVIDLDTRARLNAIFARLIERNDVARYVPGVGRFDLSMIRPALRAELDRRIIAAADYIKLRRRESIEHTLQRFRGWSTSIPPGGDGAIDKREVRADIAKSVTQFRFERRRVDIDQGYKLISNVAEIVATDQGAIAGIWHDHGEHDRNYAARKEHMARAGKLFLVRDSWAINEGLVRRGARPYMDDISKPGQEPYCRCWYQYVTSPRRLPDDVLTRAGHAWLATERKAA